MLDYSTFVTVVKNTPLVSIDLLIVNREEKFLLGWRVNPPLKNCWFVPGGRIAKGEKVSHAFKRICLAELGKKMDISLAKFQGVYEHIYPDENFTGSSDFGTHYVVLGFRIDIDHDFADLPMKQHQHYRWATIAEMLEDEKIHQNVKNYFNGYMLF